MPPLCGARTFGARATRTLGARFIELRNSPKTSKTHAHILVTCLTGTEAAGLPVTTSAGISVGDSFDTIDLSGAAPPLDYTSPETGRTQRMVRVDLVALPPGEGTGPSPDIGVLVTGSLDDAVVDRIESPSSNYGH